MIFVNPLYFFGLLAVAVPVVVHLFSFRRYKKMYFSDLSRIAEIHAETRKTSRLKQILVLVFRILAIVFLVVAFAKPVISDGALDKSPAAVCIYIDNSPSVSLTADENDEYRNVACQKAKEIIHAHNSTDRFLIVDNDFQGNLRFGTADDAIENIENLSTASMQTLKLSEAASVVFDLLRAENTSNKKAYFISAFDKSVADLRDFPADTAVKTFFVHVENEVAPRVYIDTVCFSMPFFMPGSQTTANVLLKNPTSETVEDCELSLTCNGEKVAFSTVNLAPESRLLVPMTFTVPKKVNDSPVVFGSVQIAGNEQVMDFVGAVQSDNSVSVLDISSSETRILSKLYSVDSRVVYGKKQPGGDSDNDLVREIMKSDFLILDNVSRLNPEVVLECVKFVKRGNSLLVLPPERDPECMNSLLRQLNAPELADFSEGRRKVCGVDMRHLLYRNVFEKEDHDFEKPVAKAHYSLKIRPSVSKESILSFDNGDDFLFVSNCESGSVYVLTSPLSEEYTDFSGLPIFVPTFLNMCLLSRSTTEFYRLSNDRSPIRLENRSGVVPETEMKLVRMGSGNGDDVETVRVRQFAGQCYVDLPSETYTGCYLLMTPDGTVCQAVAFNTKPGSGVFYSVDELKQMIGNQDFTTVSVVDDGQKPLGEYIRSQNQGTPLWQWFLILSLLMLLAEILVIRFYK